MKERLDVLLVRNGFFSSREKAKATIMAGCVYVDGQKEDKAGMKFDTDLEGKVCMDIGASTGGFTDCMLQKGAAKVYSIDVGHGQLDWKLRNDPRVVCMERFNARELSAEDLPQVPDFASIDVSFISLRLILGPVFNTLSPGGSVAARKREGRTERGR